MINRLVNDIYLQAFSLLKYNLVLFIPFFLFLLVAGSILLPTSNMSSAPPIFYLFFVLPALLAVFLSGWLNMFKKCVQVFADENKEPEKRTEESFLLFKEFFPGVGKYFFKIALGLLIYFFLFNIYMLVLETIIMSLLGGFESFIPEEFSHSMKSQQAAVAFWEGISQPDRVKLFKIAGLEFVFTFIFMYLTMFWVQIIVIKEGLPLKSLVRSVKTVIGNPLSTFILFVSGFSFILLVVFIGAIVSVNPLFQLLFLILFVTTVIYYLMLTFIYLEKHELHERINSPGRSDRNGQD